MNALAKDYITSRNGQYTVHGHNGRGFGTYSSKVEAEKRLEQIEWFKKHGHDMLSASDMDPGEMETLRKLMSKFLGEEEKEPEHKAKDALITAPSSGIPAAAKQAEDAAIGHAAGIAFITGDNRVLLLKRAESEANYAGHWALPGGGGEGGETPDVTAAREAGEEIGERSLEGMTLADLVTTPSGLKFFTYIVPSGYFIPSLNGEHTDYDWFSMDDLPVPIHPGVADTFARLKLRQSVSMDALAFDRDSVREMDVEGRMHIAHVPISKAGVNPYHGYEIPHAKDLGLDPDRVYYLFRDPVELEKAADSFNGIQVLIKHTPVTANDPQLDKVVGTTGTNSVFNNPYLENELVIWDKLGVIAIESNLQRELSAGYSYKPVMEPGSYNGEHYDGRMTEIKGNHVALVSKGRAGPDVVVGDEAFQPKKETEMVKLSPTAVGVRSALTAYYAPKIAMDSALKFSTALTQGLSKIGEKEKFTRAALKKKNFKEAIIHMAKIAADESMTPEAKKGGHGPDDVIMRTLDMLDAQMSSDPEEPVGGKDGEEDGEDEEPEDSNNPGNWRENVKKKLMGDHKMSEDEANAVCDMMPEPGGTKDPGKPAGHKDGEEPGEDEEPKDMTPEEKKKASEVKKAEDKKAMDAAISAAAKKAEENTMKRLKDIRVAERAVEPLIGKIALGMDSAEEIYKAALKANNVSTDGVHPSAFPAMVQMLVERKGSVKPSHRIAQDAALTGDVAAFDKAFGIEARPIRNMGAV